MSPFFLITTWLYYLLTVRIMSYDGVRKVFLRIWICSTTSVFSFLYVWVHQLSLSQKKMTDQLLHVLYILERLWLRSWSFKVYICESCCMDKHSADRPTLTIMLILCIQFIFVGTLPSIVMPLATPSVVVNQGLFMLIIHSTCQNSSVRTI